MLGRGGGEIGDADEGRWALADVAQRTRPQLRVQEQLGIDTGPFQDASKDGGTREIERVAPAHAQDARAAFRGWHGVFDRVDGLLAVLFVLGLMILFQPGP